MVSLFVWLLSEFSIFIIVFCRNDNEEWRRILTRKFFQENFQIDPTNKYEKIDVPDFNNGRSGRFIHDFNTNYTGIIDVTGWRLPTELIVWSIPCQFQPVDALLCLWIEETFCRLVPCLIWCTRFGMDTIRLILKLSEKPWELLHRQSLILLKSANTLRLNARTCLFID